jgi:hypothetical protein
MRKREPIEAGGGLLGSMAARLLERPHGQHERAKGGAVESNNTRSPVGNSVNVRLGNNGGVDKYGSTSGTKHVWAAVVEPLRSQFQAPSDEEA